VANAAQGAYGGGAYDAFAAELTAAGTGLVYATYLGGSAEDNAYGLTLTPDGSAYVTGATSSGDFPVTGNAVQGAYGGASDAFVAGLAAIPSTCPDGWACDDIGGRPWPATKPSPTARGRSAARARTSSGTPTSFTTCPRTPRATAASSRG